MKIASQARGLFALVGSAAMFALAGAFVNVEAADAANPCGTASSRGFFDGAQSANSAPYGVRARIENRVPALCTGTAPTDSSAWVMLTGRDAFDGYAQVGYARVRTGSQTVQKRFAQSIRCDQGCGPPRTRWARYVNSMLLYTVYYNYNTQRLTMTSGRKRIDHIAFNPFQNWKTPLIGALYGETRHCQTDVIGTQSNPAQFSSIQMRAADRSWTAIPDLGGRRHCTSRYQIDFPPLGTSSFTIWTDPL